MEEKKAKILQLFHETQDFFQLKVIETKKNVSYSLIIAFIIGSGKIGKGKERHCTKFGKRYITDISR